MGQKSSKNTDQQQLSQMKLKKQSDRLNMTMDSIPKGVMFSPLNDKAKKEIQDEFFKMVKDQQEKHVKMQAAVSNAPGAAYAQFRQKQKMKSNTSGSPKKALTKKEVKLQKQQEKKQKLMDSPRRTRLQTVVASQNSSNRLSFGQGKNHLVFMREPPTNNMHTSKTLRVDQNLQQSILGDELDWISTLQTELNEQKDSIFADFMLEYIDTQLQLWHTKLDPTQFRQQYVKKVYKNTNQAKGKNRSSSSFTQNFASARNGSDTRSTTIPQVFINEYPKEYMEHDIMGLSCVSASDQYIVKFLTLRQHLEIPTHPIVKLINIFRNCVEEYFKEKIESIKQGAAIYDHAFRQQFYRGQYDKLLTKIIDQIKIFVKIMHNVIVMFYRLEVKVAYDSNESECLSNLITSLVVQNPLYTEIHELILFKHKYEIRAITKTIQSLNNQQNLEVALGIDKLQIGKQLISQNNITQTNHKNHNSGDVYVSDQASMEVNDEDQQALDAFDLHLKQFERVRHVSSPILKVISLARAMDKLLGVMSSAGEVQEADMALQMMFYCLARVRTDEGQYLGAKFLIQCTYANLLMHEDQIAVIQDYLYISHAESVLQMMTKGTKACIRKFISQNDSGTTEGSELHRSASENDNRSTMQPTHSKKPSDHFLDSAEIQRTANTIVNPLAASYNAKRPSGSPIKRKKNYTNSILEKIHREGISRLNNSTIEQSSRQTPKKNQLGISLTKSMAQQTPENGTKSVTARSSRKNPLLIETVERNIIIEEIESQGGATSSSLSPLKLSRQTSEVSQSARNTKTKQPHLDLKMTQITIEEATEADLQQDAETMRSMRQYQHFDYMNEGDTSEANFFTNSLKRERQYDEARKKAANLEQLATTDFGSQIVDANTDLIMTTTDELRIQMQPKLLQLRKSLINGLEADESPVNSSSRPPTTTTTY